MNNSKGLAKNGTVAGRNELRPPAATLTSSAPVKILVVDDRPENLLSIEAALEHIAEKLDSSSGPVSIELVRATSGTEALRKILSMDFAVILLDVQMPG